MTLLKSNPRSATDWDNIFKTHATAAAHQRGDQIQNGSAAAAATATATATATAVIVQLISCRVALKRNFVYFTHVLRL